MATLCKHFNFMISIYSVGAVFWKWAALWDCSLFQINLCQGTSIKITFLNTQTMTLGILTFLLLWVLLCYRKIKRHFNIFLQYCYMETIHNQYHINLDISQTKLNLTSLLLKWSSVKTISQEIPGPQWWMLQMIKSQAFALP